MNKILCMLLGCCVVLSGCSGASTSNNNEDLYTDNTTISKVKSLFIGRKDVTIKEVKTATIIATAFQKMNVDKFTSQADIASKTGDFFLNKIFESEQIRGAVMGDYNAFIHNESGESNYYHQMESLNKNDAVILSNMYANYLNDMQKKDFNNMAKFVIFYSTIKAIKEANSICIGWYGGDRGAEMAANYQVVLLANDIETIIAEQMINKTFKDEDSAIKFIQQAFFSISAEKILGLIESHSKIVNSAHYIANLTGVSGRQFQVDDSSITCNNSGTVWYKNNDTWFGSGNLSGQTYTSKIEYSNGLEQAKSVKIDLNNSTSNSNSNGADTSIKAK
ncbi:MAG: hypothetical protein E6Q32_05385 [Neisseriales bacterium]|nr:MAG: hypothetical protein E6Q32_05385 [Neisseriales bacterium]